MLATNEDRDALSRAGGGLGALLSHSPRVDDDQRVDAVLVLGDQPLKPGHSAKASGQPLARQKAALRAVSAT